MWVLIGVAVVVVLAAVWIWLRRSMSRMQESWRIQSEMAQHQVERARARGERWAQSSVVDPTVHYVKGDIGRLVEYFGGPGHGSARDSLLAAIDQGRGEGAVEPLCRALASEDPTVALTALGCLAAYLKRNPKHRAARRALQQATRHPVIGATAQAVIQSLDR